MPVNNFVTGPEKSQSPCETDAIDNPAPSTSNTIGKT